MERFHLDIELRLKSFEDESASNTAKNVRPGDHVGGPFHAAGMAYPVAWLVDWYNSLPHMPLMDTARRLLRKHTRASRDYLAKYHTTAALRRFPVGAPHMNAV